MHGLIAPAKRRANRQTKGATRSNQTVQKRPTWNHFLGNDLSFYIYGAPVIYRGSANIGISIYAETYTVETHPPKRDPFRPAIALISSRHK